MTAFYGTNVTHYNNGGSGDDLIPNGYVRTVEKIWMDTFVFTAVITTADTIGIAILPQNAKVTGVEVYLPVAFTPTSATINVGPSYSTALFITSSTLYVGGTSSTLVFNKVTMNNPAGMGYILTGSTNLIYLSLGVTAAVSPTAGTITTIIKYT